MFRVLADHPHYSLAMDDLALIANLLNRCSYLHNSVLTSQSPVLTNCNCVFFQILRFAQDDACGLPLRSRPLNASTSIASSLLIDSLKSVLSSQQSQSALTEN